MSDFLYDDEKPQEDYTIRLVDLYRGLVRLGTGIVIKNEDSHSIIVTNFKVLPDSHAAHGVVVKDFNVDLRPERFFVRTRYGVIYVAAGHLVTNFKSLTLIDDPPVPTKGNLLFAVNYQRQSPYQVGKTACVCIESTDLETGLFGFKMSRFSLHDGSILVNNDGCIVGIQCYISPIGDLQRACLFTLPPLAITGL